MPLCDRLTTAGSLLLTFGLASIIEDVVRTIWGAQGVPFEIPTALNSPVRSSQAQ